jgi:hypothetical protein
LAFEKKFKAKMKKNGDGASVASMGSGSRSTSSPATKSSTYQERQQQQQQRKQQQKKLTVKKQPPRTSSNSSLPGSITYTSNSSVTSSTSDLDKAEQLLQGMRRAIATLTEQENELSKSLSIHTDRANARSSSGNSVGAVLSIKKTRRVQGDIKRLVAVIDHVESQQDRLSSQVNEFKAVRTLQECNQDEPLSNTTTDLLVLFNFTNFAQYVENMLSEPIVEDDTALTDEELLEEFKSKASM